VKKEAETRSDQYQNGDKQQGVLIKSDVRLYLTKSYVMQCFLCISVSNLVYAFSANRFKVLDFGMLIMRFQVTTLYTLQLT